MKLHIKYTIWKTVELNSLANKDEIIAKLEAAPFTDPLEVLTEEDGIDESKFDEDTAYFVTPNENDNQATIELVAPNNHNLWTNE